MASQRESAEHRHRWVGAGEYGDSTVGQMCGDCGIDLEDLTEEEFETETEVQHG